jgi:hypothetical protein
VRVAAVTMFALAVTAGMAGCGRAASEAGSSPSDMASEMLYVPRASERSSVPPASERSSAPPVSGPKYKLSGKLCRKADLRAIEELFPTQKYKPLASTRRYCATARSSRDGVHSIGVSVDAELLPDEEWAKRFFDMSRQTATEDVHDIGGAGTEALWTGDSTSIDLTTYHGNLVLELEVQLLNPDDDLPDDMPQRLARVADGTFERLAP